MHEVHERILARAEEIAAEAAPSDELGRLTDKAAAVLRSSGVIRMLQPAEFGGHEAGPVDFFRTLRDIGVHSSSAGWVAGVVGVHAFEVAQMDIALQKEIWGEDPDTWIASPYAPWGARPRSRAGSGSADAGPSPRAPTTAGGSSSAA